MKNLVKVLAIAAVVAVGFLFFYRANYEVPILMYHRVGSPGDRSGLNVSAKTFERQMEFLKVHGYNVLPLQELISRLKSGAALPPKAVAITFDDGTLDNIQVAFPILKKVDFPATVFMITRNINEEGWLSEEDLKIMDEAGVTIGSHTVNHAFLKDMSTADVLFEIVESKKKLERVLGRRVTLLSYPAGGFNEGVRSFVQTAGYEGAVSTNHGKRKHDPYGLHRIKITEGRGSLFSFWIKTSGLYHLGKKRIPLK